MARSAIERNNVTVMGGEARPILFAHGYGCDQAMWRFVAPAFEDAHKIVLFDLTGMGKSDLSAYGDARYATLDGHAQDILEICEALDLHDVTVVGHSVSAITAMLAAIRDPARIGRLVLVAPSPSFANDGAYTGGFELSDLEGLVAMMEENYLGWARQIAPTVAGQPATGAAASELTQSFCRTDPEIAQHFGRVTFLSDRRADVPKTPRPALILQCDDDALAPVAVGRWMHETMPDSTLEILRATGHCPHLTDPDQVVASIRHYLHAG
jgi:sigma-B regulation protein RsbQ